MTATCPVCTREQVDGLLCHACTTILERELGDVAAIVAELDVTMSRQDRVPAVGGEKRRLPVKDEEPGLSAMAHTRTPVHWGASAAADDLGNTLTTWARDVCPPTHLVSPFRPTEAASFRLLSCIPEIRRHPAVDELFDEITDAIRRARAVIDRPADRVFVGQCLTEFEGVTCERDLYARPGAAAVKCGECGITHEVAERRKAMLREAEDRLLTVPQASLVIGELAGITVTQARIRGYLHRGTRLQYRAPAEAKRFRLGDLLDVVMDESERRSA